MGDAVNVDPLTKAIHTVGSRGKIGREVAIRLDLLRSTGPRYAWRRLREDVALSRLGREGFTDPVYRAIWVDAARDVGAEVIDLGYGFLKIRTDQDSTIVWNQWVMLDDVVTLRLSLQKALVHRLLSSVGVPVPEHVEFCSSDLGTAIAFLKRDAGPYVVKPVASSGGYGVTSGIRSVSQLKRATLRASRTDQRLVIERQVPGDFYRFLFLDGDLIGIVRRRPPRVTGDGKSTIADLIIAENRRRLDRRRESLMFQLRADLDSVFTLESAGLSLSSVPPLGLTVPVKTVVSQNGPEDNETVRDSVSEDVIRETATAAGTIGVRLCGVDVITPDVKVPLEVSGGMIIEVNGTPGLTYHYDVSDRANATRVAVPILRMLLSRPSVLSARHLHRVSVPE